MHWYMSTCRLSLWVKCHIFCGLNGCRDASKLPRLSSILAEGDQQIFELCVATERSRLLYRILASLLQGILLGLLLATFFMEMEMMLGLTASPKEVAGFGAGVVSLKLVGRLKCFRARRFFLFKMCCGKICACFLRTWIIKSTSTNGVQSLSILHWCLLPQMSSCAHH